VLVRNNCTAFTIFFVLGEIFHFDTFSPPQLPQTFFCDFGFMFLMNTHHSAVIESAATSLTDQQQLAEKDGKIAELQQQSEDLKSQNESANQIQQLNRV
jgi:hypothetical protein